MDADRDRGRRAIPGRRSPKLASMAALALSAVIAGGGGAAAGEVDCNSLIDQAFKTGETYRVTIDVAREAVRINTAGGKFCYESIPGWTSRELPMVWGDKQPSAAAPPSPPSELLAPEGTGSEEQDAARRLPQAKPPCDLRLDRYWNQGKHEIEGVRYWLIGVFTLDLDNDDWTDDVGFNLATEDGGGLVLRYFGTSGTLTARDVASLKLVEDADIPRLCYGRFSFPMPEIQVSDEPLIVVDVPDLASEMARKTATGMDTGKETGKDPGKGSFGALGMIVFGFALVAFIAAVVVAFLTRHRWLPAGRHREEDEEDEEDEDDWQ